MYNFTSHLPQPLDRCEIGRRLFMLIPALPACKTIYIGDCLETLMKVDE